MIPTETKGTGQFFPHDTDIGIIGRGVSIESCFEEIAKVMFSLVADTANIHEIQVITFEFQGEDPELTLITWLNLLLVKANEHHLVFGDVRLKREGTVWKATVSGEPQRKDLPSKNEIKGVLLEMVSVKKVDHLWEARCVIDV